MDRRGREETRANRPRILGRLEGPKAESEKTVKLLGPKSVKTPTQGQKRAAVISHGNTVFGFSARRHAFFSQLARGKSAGASVGRAARTSGADFRDWPLSSSDHSLGAASFFASRFFCRRSLRDAACFARRALRLTFFLASRSLRRELPAGLVVAMILLNQVSKIESRFYNHKTQPSQAGSSLITLARHHVGDARQWADQDFTSAGELIDVASCMGSLNHV